jgi:hypothetical protein
MMTAIALSAHPHYAIMRVGHTSLLVFVGDLPFALCSSATQAADKREVLPLVSLDQIGEIRTAAQTTALA